MLDSNQLLDITQFVRAIGVNRTSPHSLFLGAGASISSGVKSGYDCIWEWKRQIFISSNPGLEKIFSDASSHSARTKIQHWLDLQGRFPQRDSQEEYTFYAEDAYPIPSTRRSFFQNISKDAVPSSGYHLLCLLAKDRIVRKIWTTNFDHLVAKAAAFYNLTPVEIGLDATHRIERIAVEGELLINSLHGDYRYDQLKNTEAELQYQDKVLRSKLIEDTHNSHLLIIGFSGNDLSVMKALEEAYSVPSSGRLYWCGYGPPTNPLIMALFQAAKLADREAYYIQTNGFDDLMMRVGKFCLSSETYSEAEPHFKRIDSLKNEFTPFNLRANRIDAVIKSNLLPLTIPSELFQLQSPLARAAGAWSKIREITAQAAVVAGPLKQRLVAIGTLSEITKIFAEHIESPLVRIPINSNELFYENGTIRHILTSAITICIAQRIGLPSDRRGKIWQISPIISKSIGGIHHKVYKAINVSIENDDNGLCLLVKPGVEISRADGEKVEKSIRQALSKEILDKMYNGVFNADFEEWRKQIFDGQGAVTLEFPEKSGSGFHFTIQSTPLFAKIENHTSVQSALIDNPKYYRFSAKQFREPALLFSSRDGKNEIANNHPLLGLTQNKPYDFSLTITGLSKQTMLGVVCPMSHAQKFSSFLDRQHQSVPVSNQRENYTIDYPGYAAAYGIALNIPSKNDARWQDVKVDPDLNFQRNALHIAVQTSQIVLVKCA